MITMTEHLIGENIRSQNVKIKLKVTRRGDVNETGISYAACIINYINRHIIIAGDGNTPVCDEDVITIIRGCADRRFAMCGYRAAGKRIDSPSCTRLRS